MTPTDQYVAIAIVTALFFGVGIGYCIRWFQEGWFPSNRVRLESDVDAHPFMRGSK